MAGFTLNLEMSEGLVKTSEVYTGDAAQEILDVYQTKAQKKAEKAGMEYTGIEGTAKTAEATVDAKEIRHTHICVRR